jgi:hypothetical protein
MNRKLTRQEKIWLLRGLRSLKAYQFKDRKLKGKHSILGKFFKNINVKNALKTLDSLRVISKCGCGDPKCHTVQFQHFKPFQSIGFIDRTGDHRYLLIGFDKKTKMLSEIEVI